MSCFPLRSKLSTEEDPNPFQSLQKVFKKNPGYSQEMDIFLIYKCSKLILQPISELRDPETKLTVVSPPKLKSLLGLGLALARFLSLSLCVYVFADGSKSLLEVLLPPLKTDTCSTQGSDLTEGVLKRVDDDDDDEVRRSEGGEMVPILVIICHHATLEVKLYVVWLIKPESFFFFRTVGLVF